MRRLKFYFTLIVLVFFINIQAQKNNVISANYYIIKTQPLFIKLEHSIKLRDDISNCQSNIKFCLDKWVKMWTRNTFNFKKVAYINEEGIVFNTKTSLRIVVWYGF